MKANLLAVMAVRVRRRGNTDQGLQPRSVVPCQKSFSLDYDSKNDKNCLKISEAVYSHLFKKERVRINSVDEFTLSEVCGGVCMATNFSKKIEKILIRQINENKK